MNAGELLRWQWDGYLRYHQSRANLLLHIVVVPLFLLGNIALVTGLIMLSWAVALGGLLLVLLAIVAIAGDSANPVSP